jgi:hypothetical protein
LDEFRRWVADVLGPLAAAILDQRLAGEETKGMVGQPQFGSPTVFEIKKTVQAVKAVAHRFAAQSRDPALMDKVDRAMEREADSVAKRQRATAARRPAG